MILLHRLGFIALLAASLQLPAAHGAAVAVDDTFHVLDKKVATLDVLKNDSSTKSQPLTLVSITQTANATATIENNKVTFTPGPAFDGTGSFEYTVSDGAGAAATGKVTITHTAVTATGAHQVVNGNLVTLAIASLGSSPDGDDLTVTSVTHPAAGKASISADGKSITYTPNARFTSSDQFEYTVADAYGSATGTVTLVTPLTAAIGSTGLAITDGTGKTVGFISLDVLSTGAFTGQIDLRGTHYALLGVLNRHGNFSGVAHGDHGMVLPVQIAIDATAQSAAIKVVFPTGDAASQAISTITVIGRGTIEGRYTILFQPAATSASGSQSSSSASSGSSPDGIGWMTMRIDARGYAKFKGMGGDGNKLSGFAVLGGSDSAPELVLFAGGKVSALAGTLKFTAAANTATTLAGDFTFSGDATQKKFYPDGFNADVTATGAEYNEPSDGQSAFSDQATLAASGGHINSFSTTVQIGKNGHATATNGRKEDLNLKVYRRDGTFSGNFRSPDRAHRYSKFAGVIVQGTTSTGGGVFRGDTKAGQVTLTASTTAN